MSYAREVYLLAVPMHKITGLTWLNFSGLLSYAGVSLHLAMHFLAFFLGTVRPKISPSLSQIFHVCLFQGLG